MFIRFYTLSGTPAMTTGGYLEGEIEMTAEFLLRAVHIAVALQWEHGKLQKDFLNSIQSKRDIVELWIRVWGLSFTVCMPGSDIWAFGDRLANTAFA